MNVIITKLLLEFFCMKKSHHHNTIHLMNTKFGKTKNQHNQQPKTKNQQTIYPPSLLHRCHYTKLLMIWWWYDKNFQTWMLPYYQSFLWWYIVVYMFKGVFVGRSWCQEARRLAAGHVSLKNLLVGKFFNDEGKTNYQFWLNCVFWLQN